MNIFATYTCPIKSARALDDLRVNKMIVESAQMLSTAVRYYGYKKDDVYKSSYLNHPCTVWARTNIHNFMWLVLHATELCDIYRRRSGRNHGTLPVISKCAELAKLLPDGDKRTPFADCTLFKHLNLRTIEKYRLTMSYKWENDLRRPTWHGRLKPRWFKV